MQVAEQGFEDVEVGAIYGRMGKQYSPFVSAKFRLGYGLGSGSLVDPVFAQPIEFELQEFYGTYIRLGAPAGDRFYPYLLLGYTQVGFEQMTLGVTTEDKVDDLFYGLGADWALWPHVQASLEIVCYADKSGSTLTALSLGVAKAF